MACSLLPKATLMQKGRNGPPGTRKGFEQVRSGLSCSSMHSYGSVYWLFTDMAMLRTYTMAFGYAIAELLPRMHEGIKGLRFGQDSWQSLNSSIHMSTFYMYVFISVSIDI